MMKDVNIKPLLMIGGPTASGKSALAIAAAKALKGEVVNIDSVQAYRYLDIGSAKVTDQESYGVRHHLLDLWEPNVECKVAQYIDAANVAIRDIQKRKKQAVVVAGSTMYAPALLYGLASLPKSDPVLRQELLGCQTEELYKRLREVDRLSAKRLHPNDRKRIVRALESTILSGNPASDSLEKHGFRHNKFPAIIIVLCWPRDVLYQRISERAALMVMSGLLRETRTVLERFGRSVRALDSVGYRQACACLMGELPRENLIEEITQYTRRLAKRQLTFWRNEPIKRGWIVLPSEKDSRSAVVCSDFKRLTMQAQVKDFLAYNLGFSDLLNRIKARLGEPLDNIELWYVNAETVFASE
jgi:tRNA dimethylallyltransferase